MCYVFLLLFCTVMCIYCKLPAGYNGTKSKQNKKIKTKQKQQTTTKQKQTNKQMVGPGN